MTLDATARSANVKDSVKKFFIDNLKRTSGIPVTFDKGLTIPIVQGVNSERWVSVLFDSLYVDVVSNQELRIMPCTKKDNEGYKLAQLRDILIGYLTDITQNDGIRRIPLYRSHQTDVWVQIGSMMVYIYPDSGQLVASDETKFKVIPVTLKWGAII